MWVHTIYQPIVVNITSPHNFYRAVILLGWEFYAFERQFQTLA